MPRTTISPTALPGPYPTAVVVLPFSAADVANLNQVQWTGKEIILAQNTDAVAAHNVTLSSTVDSHDRSGDIGPTSVAASTTVILAGPLPEDGWRNSDGYIYFQADNVAVKFAVLRLP